MDPVVALMSAITARTRKEALEYLKAYQQWRANAGFEPQFHERCSPHHVIHGDQLLALLLKAHRR